MAGRREQHDPRRALGGLAVAVLLIGGGLVLFAPPATPLQATPTTTRATIPSASASSPPLVIVPPPPSLDLDFAIAPLAQGAVRGNATGAGIVTQVFVASIEQPGPFIIDLACAGPGVITWVAQMGAAPGTTASASHPCGGPATHDVQAAGLTGPFDVSIATDGAASWAWAISVIPAPTPVLPPTPTPGPTPACPPAEPYGSFPPPPVVALSGAGQVAVGDAWSDALQSCTSNGASDGVPAIPEKGLTVHRGDTLTISAGVGVTLFEVRGALYGAAVGAIAPDVLHDLGLHAGPTTGTWLLDVPPVGDWVIEIGVGVNDVAHGAVWSQDLIFRVAVAP